MPTPFLLRVTVVYTIAIVVICAIIAAVRWRRPVRIYEGYISSDPLESYARGGIGGVSGCADSAVVSFGDSFDNLINEGFFKPEFTDPYKQEDIVNRRACQDIVEQKGEATLVYAANSSGASCGFNIDGQDYELRYRTLKLNIDLLNSSESKLVVRSKDEVDNPFDEFYDAANFRDFLLSKPAFFVIADSQPYNIMFDYFTFGTYPVPNVSVYDQFPTDKTTLTITASPNAANIFPNTQIKTLAEVFIAKRNETNLTDYRMDVTFYYIDRINLQRPNAGSATEFKALPTGEFLLVNVQDILIMDAINKNTKKRINDIPQLDAMLQLVNKPDDDPKRITNPTFTLQFGCRIPSDPNRETHLVNPYILASVTPKDRDASCDWTGRGILTVMTRTEALRGRTIPPISFVSETVAASSEWACIDFLSITKDTKTGDIFCGLDNNTVSLWVPCNVHIDIICCLSPTMRMAAATFYNTELEKRELVFVQSYHCDGFINDLVGTIRYLGGELYLESPANSVDIDVDNMRFMYGLGNVREWYDDHTLRV